MKNAKVLKPLLLSAAAVMLVVATMFATMAYLTSSAAVSNVFTVGNVKLHMFESKVTPDGEIDSSVEQIKDGMKVADTNSYHLQPGASYTKDPTVYVDANSDESYLFIRLLNDLKSIEKQGDVNHPTIVEQLRKNGWLEIERADSNVDAVFVYVGVDKASELETVFQSIGTVGSEYSTQAERTEAIHAATAEIKAHIVGGKDSREAFDVFEEFTLAEKVDNLQIFGGARVAIVAYAIQARGVTEDVDIGTQAAYLKAWDYVKTELPFVD